LVSVKEKCDFSNDGPADLTIDRVNDSFEFYAMYQSRKVAGFEHRLTADPIRTTSGSRRTMRISTDDLGVLGSARFPVYSIQAVTLCCIPVVTRRPGEQRKAFLN